MCAAMGAHHPEPTAALRGLGSAERAQLVHEELGRILESRLFKNAGRCKQFLEFVVVHSLSENPEHLKERTIGVEVFHRDPGYSTGEDPVVRVQAGEVRRRLEQYYQETPHSPAVRIVLPVGSYSPQFVWNSVSTDPTATVPNSHESAKTNEPSRKIRFSLVLNFVLLLTLISLALVFVFRPKDSVITTPSALSRFWAPAFSTQQPVLICLAQPIVYRPSPALYDAYARKHPGTFETQVERYNRSLPLDGSTPIKWSDMVPIPRYGVAIGDVYAAVKISAVLGSLNKPSQVRIGSHYSFEDLRNSPSVLVGAFNNKWTMQFTPNLHFAFVEQGNNTMIREQGPQGRTWSVRVDPQQISGEDYAIVARLLDSKTGQFTIAVAGITDSGTQAAGEFVSNPKLLEEALAGADPNWPQKNMELLLKTTITDSVSGPPQVIASYFW